MACGFSRAMRRGPRLDAPGGIHHVIARGIEPRQLCRTDADRSESFGVRAPPTPVPFASRFGDHEASEGLPPHQSRLFANAWPEPDFR